MDGAVTRARGGSALAWSSSVLLRHKLIVVTFWLGVLAVGVVTAPQVSQRLSGDFSLPSQPGYRANQAIAQAYGSGGHAHPVVPVVQLPAGTTVDSPGMRDRLRRAFAALTRDPSLAGEGVPGLRMASWATTGDRRFVSADGRTTFALVFAPFDTALDDAGLGEQVAAALRGSGALPPGSGVWATGLDQLAAARGSGGGSRSPSVLALTLAGGIGALAVLLVVFGSLLALTPLLVALVSILATFAVVDLLAAVTEVNVIVEYLVALIGLGVAIDYSLLLVTRWREERAAGHQGDEAVHRAVASAGRAVLLSGSTVAVGLLSMVVLPVPFLRSVGYAGMLIPLLSVLVTLTLLPVVLAGVGQRLDWPRWRLRKAARPGRAWTGWARLVVRRRWVAVLLAAGILLALSSFAVELQTGQSRAGAFTVASAGHAPADEGLARLRAAGIPTGVLTPIELLVPVGTGTHAGQDPGPGGLAARLGRLPGIWDAVAPGDATWRRDGTAVVDVQPIAEGGSRTGVQAVERVRAAVRAQPPGGQVQVGGVAVQDIDFSHAVYGRLPLMLAVIAAISLLLLARAFRSLLLAVKAIVADLLSIGAAFGAIVLVWQQGHGSTAIWGIPATGAVDAFIPLMVFAFLFGLSMDYEVFLLARMREAYDRTGSTTEAIVEGVGRTGQLVTSAALILFLAFAALSTAPLIQIKVFASALGAGILLDATVVRSLLVPALVALFGRWNWWLPTWAAKPLRVTTSSAPRDAATAPTQAGTAANEQGARRR